MEFLSAIFCSEIKNIQAAQKSPFFFFLPQLLKVTHRITFFLSLNKYLFLGGLLFWNAYS